MGIWASLSQHPPHGPLGRPLLSSKILGQALRIGTSVDLAIWRREWPWAEKHKGVWDKRDAVMNRANCALHEIAHFPQRLRVPSRAFTICSHVTRWCHEASHVPHYNHGAVILCFHEPAPPTRLWNSLSLGLCLISFLSLQSTTRWLFHTL